MPRTWPVAWGCISALLCLAPIAQGADAPDSDRRAVLARQRDHYLQTVEALQPLAEHRKDQILNLHVRDGQLSLSTPLKPQPDFESRRADIQGIALPAAVTYVQFVPNNPAARQFDLKLDEYPDPDTYAQLHFQWQPDPLGRTEEVSIDRTQQTSQGFLRVFYHQGSSTARVLVFTNDASTDHNVESFNCTEKDFATLCRLHPIEVEQYLRPILHLMGQDVVFAPDTNVAWQVLEAKWPVGDRISGEVKRILPKLEDSSSRVRNDATDRLAGLGLSAATAILRMDRSGLSPEQNIRLDNVLSHYCQIRTDVARQLADDPDFLLDCVYCDDQTVRKLAVARLTLVLGHAVNLDPNAPNSARIEAVDQLREALDPVATADFTGGAPPPLPVIQNR